MDRIFYAPEIQLDLHALNDIESKHCIKVLRLKIGDEIVLNDGVGNFYFCEIIDDNYKKCIVQIKSKQEVEKTTSVNIHIAIAPTKNIDRFEWFLEKTTEIGIDEITPILCERSERKDVKIERVEKIVISAMKQSLKAHLPKLNSLTSFSTLVKTPLDGEKYIAHCNNATENLVEIYKKGTNAFILIGPEGDFTEKEIKLAKENNFKEISLGKSRLRTETAGIVVCDIINVLNSI
ncbi:MAG TPA: 16S rRNA (uracil(1498)-N(3))-methyltransferase [Bacteroidales bacterium]|nr:MAG: 16S rRNA (uracil(1498)-N(3))-methyltransferase [Bacteroidetes bacterium GWF2_33_38]OFY88342.1 MAG: 16S rRNA (uracil(1498)-N(3))-methyltransferase [Bacteroidetes bacterium RIFOXYA2_FULL_33_7]HBF87332.1 16S rRNA (uracil(1498)-N(3))-methyltransferase [Bacteroidales bacterium]